MYFLEHFQNLKSSQQPCLIQQNKEITWQTYHQNCTKFALSLRKNNISKNVAIMGFNSPEWFTAAIGSIMAGNSYTGIYPTNGPDEVEHIFNTCETEVLIIENTKLLESIKLQKKLKLIIIYNEEPQELFLNQTPIKTFKEFIGESSTFVIPEFSRKPNDVITYIMTSGTTSRSKAVEITYENICFTCSKMTQIYNLKNERIVSYLPLSHIAASMLDMFCHFYHQGQIHFAKPDALQGTLVDTLKVANPTVFLAVPRVWEKIMEKMQATAAKKYSGTIGQILKSIMDFAKRKALEYHEANMNQQEISKLTTVIFNICKLLFFRKIKNAIGLNSCKYFLSGAAPIAKDTLDYFTQIDIVIYEIFGMSETCGVISGSNEQNYRKGSVGKPLIGSIKIASDGEILYNGKNNFIGYRNNPTATKETLHNEWLHTGDVGHIDKDGFLFITGRKKELIITAGGENVAPVLIEQQIKKYAPNISQVVVIGDHKKFLSCLITTTDNKKDWQKYCQNAIDKYNEKPISKAQKIQKFTVLKEDLTIDNGCMTPTMKLKRTIIQKKFQKEIDAMYN